jgi:hypothetical protein
MSRRSSRRCACGEATERSRPVCAVEPEPFKLNLLRCDVFVMHSVFLPEKFNVKTLCATSVSQVMLQLLENSTLWSDAERLSTAQAR